MCQSVNNAKIKTMYFESWDTKRIENGRFDRWIFKIRLQRLFDTVGFVVFFLCTIGIFFIEMRRLAHEKPFAQGVPDLWNHYSY